jgi:hypothetical protein
VAESVVVTTVVTAAVVAAIVVVALVVVAATAVVNAAALDVGTTVAVLSPHAARRGNRIIIPNNKTENCFFIIK